MDNIKNKILCKFCKNLCKNPIKLPCHHFFCKNCFNENVVYISNDAQCPNCQDCFTKRQVISDQINYDALKAIVGYIKPPEGGFRFFDNDKLQLPFIPRHFNENSTRNSKGETKLHTLCMKGDIEGIKKLILDNCDINATDYGGWTPLHEAVLKKRLDIVKLLVNYGAIIDCRGGNYQTPLHKAAISESVEITKYLLENGADKNSLDYFGNNAENLSDSKEVKKVIRNFNKNVPKSLPFSFVNKCVTAYCHSINSHYLRLLKKSPRVNVTTIDGEFTHLIVRRNQEVCFEILLGMLKGAIILPQEWINDFLKSGVVLPNATETITNIVHDPALNKGIQKSIIGIRLKEPKLFNGINFFIESLRRPVQVLGLTVTVDLLKKLIQAGEGKLLTRPPTEKDPDTVTYLYPYHARNSPVMQRCSDIILKYDLTIQDTISYNMIEMKTMSYEWFFKSIINYEIK